MFVLIVLSCFLRVSCQEQIIFRNGDDFIGQTERVTDNGCNTPNGSRGECINILECPDLLALIAKPDRHDFLKESRCGWDQDRPLVCCSNETSTNIKRNCTASELHWCSPVGFDECCIPELTYNIDVVTNGTVEPVKAENCEISLLTLETSSGCCGLQASNILNIREVSLMDQYPWAAIIEYVGPGAFEVKCGGTLITERYVLTAAHCLFIENWTPINIRLGDFDINHPGKDCSEEEPGDKVCTDGALLIPIEKSIAHPEYSVDIRAQTNDIALIKLGNNAPYTEFMRPICLPSVTNDFSETANSNTRLQVVGWGLMPNVHSHNQLKRHVKLSFVNEESCFMSYRQLNIVLDEGQICARGEIANDSCKGDSGGALMLVNNQRAEIVGISSFSSCGRTNRPAVYTKVFHYLTWIKSNIH